MPARLEDITSAHNPVISLIRSLAQRKQREKSGLFICEGLDFAEKARHHRYEPKYLLLDRLRQAEIEIAAIASWAAAEGARVATVQASLLSRLTGRDNPQPLLLVCRQRWEKDGVPDPATSCAALALADVRDPGNLGTILRTAEAVGVTQIMLVGQCCDPFSPECVRASMGSIFAARLTKLSETSFLDTARAWPGDVVGLEPLAREIYKSKFKAPVLLTMGNESTGLPEPLLAACTRRVSIPMSTGVESLNVAAAAAIMLYELQLPFILRAVPKES